MSELQLVLKSPLSLVHMTLVLSRWQPFYIFIRVLECCKFHVAEVSSLMEKAVLR